jgi:hypothetical protein
MLVFTKFVANSLSFFFNTVLHRSWKHRQYYFIWLFLHVETGSQKFAFIDVFGGYYWYSRRVIKVPKINTKTAFF